MAGDLVPEWEWIQGVPKRLWYTGQGQASDTRYSHYGHGEQSLTMYPADPPEYRSWDFAARGVNPFNVPGDYVMLHGESFVT